MPGACAPSTKRVHAARFQFPDDPAQRQHHGGVARHVIQQNQTRARCDGLQNGRRDRIRSLKWKRNLRHDELCARALRCFNQNIPAGIVVETGRQQLIARRSFREQHGIHPGGGVCDKDQIAGTGPINFASARRAGSIVLHNAARETAPARLPVRAATQLGERGWLSDTRQTNRDSGTPSGPEPQKRREAIGFWRRQFA